MAYDFYFDKTRLPIPPAKMQLKVNGKNRAAVLIDEGEINILKKAGLSDITFSVLLPNVSYPFAQYDDGFKNAAYFLGIFEKLKTQTDDKGKLLPFQFIVSRVLPNGKVLYNSNIKVSLEDYRINEDSKNGFDIAVDITLKQYKSYGTKTIEIIPPQPEQPTTTTTPTTATVEPVRPAENPPTQATHTVVSGDSLWAIAQRHLGNGNRYPEIYELNKAAIDARNSGTGNTRYTIYPGQVFVIPA